MKNLIIKTLFVLLLFSTPAFSFCHLDFPSEWLEYSNDNNKLHIKVSNDRNLYISYFIGEKETLVDVAHKIYVCNKEKLYLLTEDDTVELYAFIENMGGSKMALHFIKNGEVRAIVDFKRINKH